MTIFTTQSTSTQAVIAASMTIDKLFNFNASVDYSVSGLSRLILL